jgi:nucleotide-binding universal stress UspA family protein
MHSSTRRQITANLEGGPGLLQNVLVPIASLEDAEATCRAVLDNIAEAGGRITATHVIDTQSDWHDMDPREYRRKLACDALDLVTRRARAHGIRVDIRVIESQEITAAILALADEVDASAILFTPRSSGRLNSSFASGVAWTLVKTATRPVVVVPQVE